MKSSKLQSPFKTHRSPTDGYQACMCFAYTPHIMHSAKEFVVSLPHNTTISPLLAVSVAHLDYLQLPTARASLAIITMH